MTERFDESDHGGLITIDLDAKEYGSNQFRLKAVAIWHNLKDIATDVDVHVSSSGLGLHFRAWTDRRLEFYEEVAMRREYGDDPRRIDMDIQRWFNGLYTGVLFEDKDNRDHEKERRFRDVYDALDWIDNQRDDYNRVKRLAKDGHKGAPDLVRRSGADLED